MRAPSDITCASPVPSRVEHRAGKKRKNKWKKGREGKVSKEEGKKMDQGKNPIKYQYKHTKETMKI